MKTATDFKPTKILKIEINQTKKISKIESILLRNWKRKNIISIPVSQMVLLVNNNMVSIFPSYPKSKVADNFEKLFRELN